MELLYDVGVVEEGIVGKGELQLEAAFNVLELFHLNAHRYFTMYGDERLRRQVSTVITYVHRDEVVKALLLFLRDESRDLGMVDELNRWIQKPVRKWEVPTAVTQKFGMFRMRFVRWSK